MAGPRVWRDKRRSRSPMMCALLQHILSKHQPSSYIERRVLRARVSEGVQLHKEMTLPAVKLLDDLVPPPPRQDFSAIFI